MTAEEISTKDKILKVAHKLFAEKGLNAVGVREIATLADVNVAAINYHFGSKEALHFETIVACMVKMNKAINDIYQEGMNIEELIGSYYDHLLANREDLITSFKLFLNKTDMPLAIHKDDKLIGPPGGAIVLKCLKEQCPDASEEDLMWATRTIMTQVIHGALIMCNHEHSICENTGIDSPKMKNQIIRLVNAVVNDINS
jgi:AcrR family transcriptional regulator